VRVVRVNLDDRMIDLDYVGRDDEHTPASDSGAPPRYQAKKADKGRKKR
jgi:hypothetical protein